jgi:4-amino-4-deoxy-L-arabinose transferase-like glycosyltransferase
MSVGAGTPLERAREALRGAAPSPVDAAVVAALLLGGTYVYLTGLGATNLQAYDEAIYAAAARNMLERGHWLVPHVHAMARDGALRPFMDKPPLVMWLQAVAMAALGPTELAARLPSALAAIASGLVTYALGRELWSGSARLGRFVGAAGAAVFLTTPAVFRLMNGGRQGGTDMPLVLFGTVFIYALYRGLRPDRDERWLLVMGGAAGLAVLSKGVAAGTYALATLPLLVLFRDRLRERLRPFARGCAVTAALVVPWPIYALVTVPEPFVQDFLLEQVLARAQGAVTSGSGLLPFMNYPYFLEFPRLMDPWVLFLAAGTLTVPLALYRAGGRRLRVAETTPGHGLTDLGATLFAVWWLALVFWLYVAVGDHPWYLLPMYVPGALVIGRLGALAAGLGGGSRRLGVAAVLAATAVLAGRVVAIESGLPHYGPPLAGLLAVGVALGPELAGAVRRRVGPEAGTTAALVALALLVAVAGVAAPVPQGGPPSHETQKEFALATNEATPQGAAIAVTEDATNEMFTYAFYLSDRSLDPAAVEEIERGDAGYALVTAAQRSRLTRPHRVVARSDSDELDDSVVVAFERG